MVSKNGATFWKLVSRVYTCERPESGNKENVPPVQAPSTAGTQANNSHVANTPTSTPPSTPSPIKEEHNYSLPLFSDEEMEISFNASMDLFD